MTGHRTDAVYKASRTDWIAQCVFCMCVWERVGHIISVLCLCARTLHQIRAFKSFILWCCGPALSSSQNKRLTEGDSQTPVWHRMAVEIVDTVTDWDRRKCVCSSVLHHFSISYSLPLSVCGREDISPNKCQAEVSKWPSMNVTNRVASTHLPGPFLKKQILLTHSPDRSLSCINWRLGLVYAWQDSWSSLACSIYNEWLS